jgi:hypothetical protein
LPPPSPKTSRPSIAEIFFFLASSSAAAVWSACCRFNLISDFGSRAGVATSNHLY